MKAKNSLLLMTSCIIFSTGAVAGAQTATKPAPSSLKELLQLVKSGWREENLDIKKRETEFLAAKDQQKKLLKQAKAHLADLQKKAAAMERHFEENEASMTRLEETLQTRLGTMGELFGVVRQAAGEARAHIDASMTSSEFPGRGKQLEPLTQSKTLPSLDQLETLWYMYQQEMVESGRTVRFRGKLINKDGQEEQAEIVRVGVFTALAKGKYLNWQQQTGKLIELARQPARRYLQTVDKLENAKKGYVRLAVDPTKGQLLSQLVQTPSFMERIHFGGVIGYIIIAIGLLTLALGLLRLVILTMVGLLVAKQKRSKQPGKHNPLGRVLLVYSESKNKDPEILERKLDEAIMRESSRLERFLWAVKIVSVVSPLLGLLGTVTGMIQTFQSITLYGTGDPKMMAGGISEALVTTMLGLMVAIPLVLLHSWMKSITKRITDVLEVQSAGIVAKIAEEAKACEPSSE